MNIFTLQRLRELENEQDTHQERQTTTPKMPTTKLVNTEIHTVNGVQISGGNNQVTVIFKDGKMQSVESEPVEPDPEPESEPPTIPAELNKPATIQLLDRARDAGWLDENYQPMISKTRAAILAQVIGQLQSVQPRWRPFEKLWHREHMCKDYAKAQSQPSTGEIELEMKHQLTP